MHGRLLRQDVVWRASEVLAVVERGILAGSAVPERRAERRGMAVPFVSPEPSPLASAGLSLSSLALPSSPLQASSPPSS